MQIIINSPSKISLYRLIVILILIGTLKIKETNKIVFLLFTFLQKKNVKKWSTSSERKSEFKSVF